MALYLAVKRLGLEADHSPLLRMSYQHRSVWRWTVVWKRVGRNVKVNKQMYWLYLTAKKLLSVTKKYVIEGQVVMNLGFPCRTGNCLIQLWLWYSHEGICSVELVMV